MGLEHLKKEAMDTPVPTVLLFSSVYSGMTSTEAGAVMRLLKEKDFPEDCLLWNVDHIQSFREILTKIPVKNIEAALRLLEFVQKLLSSRDEVKGAEFYRHITDAQKVSPAIDKSILHNLATVFSTEASAIVAKKHGLQNAQIILAKGVDYDENEEIDLGTVEWKVDRRDADKITEIARYVENEILMGN